MKLFQLTIPNERHEQILSTLQDELGLMNVTSVEARTSSIVTFRVEDSQMQAILTHLQRQGVGVQFGFCDVMSLTPGTTLRQKQATKKKRRVGRILERSSDVGTAVPVAEMYAHIEANATLSRDSVVMLLISSTTAGMGLVGDSSLYVVASMLLSPMMGPILGCSFGFVLRDRSLFINGFLNEAFALVITLLLGMMIGALLSPYASDLNWPTSEMRSRAQSMELLFGAIVAALSGTGVALAESNANISSVVGIALAASLLPPTVNCGICFSYVILGQYFVRPDDVIGEEQKLIFYEIAVGSAMLVWINIVFIYLSAVVVFKIKQVDKFQLIRRIDEEAWTNLPRAERLNNGEFLSRSSTASTRSTDALLDGNDPDLGDDTGSNLSQIPLSPVRRRNRQSPKLDEFESNGSTHAIDAV